MSYGETKTPVVALWRNLTGRAFNLRRHPLYERGQVLNSISSSKINYLEKASDYVIAFDTMPEPFIYTSILFQGVEHSKTNASKDHAANNSYELLNKFLSNGIYDPIRETERFKAVIAKLEKYASKEA